MNQTLIEDLEVLRDNLDDCDPVYYVLNTLILAIIDGRVDELEAAITPLVECWLEESMLTDAELEARGGWEL